MFLSLNVLYRFNESFLDQECVQLVSQKKVQASSESFIPSDFIASQERHVVKRPVKCCSIISHITKNLFVTVISRKFASERLIYGYQSDWGLATSQEKR